MMKWLIAFYRGAEFQGMVRPVSLQFTTYEEADLIAQRYNFAYPYNNGHFVPCKSTVTTRAR